MIKIVPIQIDKDTVIYIEAKEGAIAPLRKTEAENSESYAKNKTPKGLIPPEPKGFTALQSFEAIESTIRIYTNYTLNAFRQVAIANVEEVVLQFGIEISGEAGIPYITRGTAKSNLNITVKCSFPKQGEPPST